LRTLVHLLGALVRALPEWVVVQLPGEAGMALRQAVYGRRMRHLGRDVLFEPGVQLIGAEHMSFGDGCWIDRYAVLIAGPPDAAGRRITRRENGAFTHAEGELVVGPGCHIAPHTVISAHGGVSIGRNTTIAAGGRVYSFTHHHADPGDPADDFPYRFSSRAPAGEQSLIAAPVVIGDDAAVGLNSVVLPGSTIGDRTWVGAASLVRGELPADAIAVGVPARPRPRRGGDGA
jgi:acetyltransferase-like isoleucine patch superfamily enzyme